MAIIGEPVRKFVAIPIKEPLPAEREEELPPSRPREPETPVLPVKEPA